MKWMVFDVGGTEIKYSVMDETLARYGSGSVPTPMTCQKDFFEEICRIFRDLLTVRGACAWEEAPCATITEKRWQRRSRR